tara:strand:+ start:3333 stop:3839 length:507 start_codon:yes stop_codon:yes gene_type:complete
VKPKKNYLRIIHRYLGFYLGGIMAVYSISGIALIFRKTDAFKKVVEITKTISPNLSVKDLESTLKIKNLYVNNIEGNIVYFDNGRYNKLTGEVVYSKKEIPFFLKKMQTLHKATTKSPVYWLNIFFGISLLFFVISSFWMFLPSTSVFKKGIYFSLAGIVMTIIILFI